MPMFALLNRPIGSIDQNTAAIQVNDATLKGLIETGDVEGARALLGAHPQLANTTVHWHLNQDNASDPLHYVADCVSQGWLTNGREGELAAVLLEHGALVDGSPGRETPLIAAASLGARKMVGVLLDAGAKLEEMALFGARALHWAAWTGLASTVELLIERGAALEPRCAEFGATPLFWAVHGFSRNGPKQKHDQIGAARALIAAGAVVATANKQGVTALEMSKNSVSEAMHELIAAHAS